MTYQEYRNMRADALTIDGALKSRTGSYWNDVAAGVYDYGVIKAILRLNGVTHYEDEANACICFKTKVGILEITSIDNVPYANYVHGIHDKYTLVKGYRGDTLKKNDYGAEIIVDLIPWSLSK